MDRKFFLLLGIFSTFCVLCPAHPTVITKASSQNDDLQYRLPRTSRPFHYDLHMKIDVDEIEFFGWETIHIDVLEPTDEIAVNYKDMTVIEETVSLLDSNNNLVQLLSFDYNNITEILRLKFPQLIPDKYYLYLEFNSTIRDDRKGLYISTYFNETGDKRNIATTFMAPNYARMAFPCYDEPEYKATYSIRISHRDSYFAISNMPALRIEPEGTTDGWLTTIFDKSLKTSTYIVAFIVCDFVGNKDPVANFTIFSQPSVIGDTDFALQYSQNVLKELELYLDRKFQYPKMDIIAIDDFLMGAMENWGIITYLSSRILVNDRTDEKAKHQVAKTIAHELAHQWFGNEVTHFYWSAVWLKEGLASLFEDSISGIIFPDWRTEDKFTLDTMLAVMQDDAGKTGVRQMFMEVETVEEIRNIYDFVTYKKAASVMRTMANILTGPVFKAGLKKYINDFSFDVAAPDDLSRSWQWSIDQNVPGSLPPIKEVFDTWINNPGFPFITVTRNYDSSRVSISQQRFMATLDYTKVPETRYYIPLNYASPSKNSDFADTSVVEFLKHTDNSVEFPVQAQANDWVIFNSRSTMYYRVNYDERNWELITEALTMNHNTIDPSNRAQLIDDSFNLARYGYLPYKFPLDLMKNYFKNERYYYAAASGIRNLEYLKTNLQSIETEMFSTFILDLLTPVYNEIGLEELPTDDHLQKMLRTDVLLLICRTPKSPCIQDAYNYLKENLQNEISTNVRRAIYRGAIQYDCREYEENCQIDFPGFKILTDKLSKLTRTEASRRKNSLEIGDILSAFGCVTHSNLINQVISIIIHGYPFVEFENSYYNTILNSLLYSEEKIKIEVLEFLRDYLQTLQDRLDGLSGIFATIGNVGVTEEHKSLMLQIIERYMVQAEGPISESMQKTIDTALDNIEENLAWNTKLSGEVLGWLTENTSGSGTIYLVNILLFITALSLHFFN